MDELAKKLCYLAQQHQIRYQIYCIAAFDKQGGVKPQQQGSKGRQGCPQRGQGMLLQDGM